MNMARIDLILFALFLVTTSLPLGITYTLLLDDDPSKRRFPRAASYATWLWTKEDKERYSSCQSSILPLIAGSQSARKIAAYQKQSSTSEATVRHTIPRPTTI